MVFALAGASRESGNKLLALVYPDHDFLYLGLALGLPSIVWLWLISLRRPERTRLNALVSQGRWVTLLSIAAQWAQTAHQVQLTHGTFHWSNAMTLALLTWFAMYVWRSKTVVDCLATPKV